MKLGTILHNAGAGDEGHDAEDLTKLLQEKGFDCRYMSVKERAWKRFGFETDFLVIAGGDGTVRKVIKALLDRKMIAKTWPIAVLPLGTANNIAKTLNLQGDEESIVASWHQHKVKRMDVGCIYYRKEHNFFLESFGYGLFPYLMQEMKKQREEFDSPEQKLKTALATLRRLTTTYQPKHCRLIVDEVDHSGNYLLVEMMNTQSFGPNLVMAPDANPGDGLLDVVVVQEQDKDKLLQYLQDKLEGKESSFAFQTIRGRNIVVSWQGTHVHLDDEVIKLEEGQEVQIETKKELLEFVVTN